MKPDDSRVLAGLLAAASVAAQTADDILEGNFTALGGRKIAPSTRFQATQTGDKSVHGSTGSGPASSASTLLSGPRMVQVFDGEGLVHPRLPGFAASCTDRPRGPPRAGRPRQSTFDHAAKGHRVRSAGWLPAGEGDTLTTAKGDVRTLWFDSADVADSRTQEFREVVE
jgi:hypothetical protein